ncbi:WD40 repeat domain-containing protein [Streptomyces sp. NRRL B-1140]|uniref:WD40 repeat domain-containing protein n=1 Tax=Streptomyces sp. NRRL B-1140 TaxID=1415549 RepID=UPI000A40B416|nr:WD40 repeat domain-containing protein [Streptomyces sp. NRRL B-1140]
MPRGERPLEAGDSPLLKFAADLRRLRKEAGSPPYRTLAEHAHYSISTLSSAASGQRLPSLEVTLAYVRAWDGDTQEWERVWRTVAAELGESSAHADPVEAQGGAPYLGLAAFQTRDAQWFFGRERLVAELVERLDRQRFVVVYGASGSGKSSLLRAGLAHRLITTTPVIVFTPGARPLEECAVRLGALAGVTPGGLYAELASGPENLGRVVRQIAARQGEGDGDVVLVVDQFEEVFTLCGDDAERDGFITALVTAASAVGSRCRIVLGVRADFFAHCTRHALLVEAMREGPMPVGPMTLEELRQAVVQPAQRAGLTVQGALLAALTAQAHRQAGVLPLLSHALLQTWRRRRGNVLTLEAFDATGGLEGALARTAEGFYQGLDAKQRELAREVFVRLAALGEDTEDTRRPAQRRELEGLADSGDDVSVILDEAAKARLLSLDCDRVEIAHEALIRCWPRLHGWLSEDRDALRTLRQLTHAAQEWQQLGGDPGALYRGTRLDMAAALGHRSLSALERSFLDAGFAARVSEGAAVRHRTRIRRLAVALLGVLALVATTAAIWATEAQRTADRERDVAMSRELSARGDALLNRRPEEAMLLALGGLRKAPTTEARSSLLSAYNMHRANQLTAHTGSVNAVAFTPDGHTLASAGEDHSVKLWNTATRRLTATLGGHTDAVTGVAFSSDGRTLATAGADGSVKLWNPATQRETATLTGQGSALNALALSPDGRVLASAGNDGTVRLWSTSHRRAIATLSGRAGAVHAVAFSPDGRKVATAGADRTVRVWDAASRRIAARFTGHVDTVRALAFSPDGRTLASAGDDTTTRLWSLKTQRIITVLRGNGDSVRAVAFSPDGRTVATTAAHSTVRLWNRDTHRQVGVLTGNTDAVNAVVFSSDGGLLATAGADGTVRLYNPATRRALITFGDTPSALRTAFSADGRTLATGFGDGTVRLYDVDRQQETAMFTAHDNGAWGVAFSPDGRTLATTGADKTVRLWNTATHRQTAVLTGHRKNVLAAAYSPDGRILATACYDGTVRLWDVSSRRAVVLAGHTDAALAVAFSPDGKTLASAGADGTTRLWDTTTQQSTATLTGHEDAVSDVAFSPDGQTLASAGADGTTRLWDTTTQQSTATLTGHHTAVSAIAFSRNGHLLITGGQDGTLRLWDVTRRRTVAVLRSNADRLNDLALGPDGRTLATTLGEPMAKVRLWNLDVRQVTRLTCRASNAHHWPKLLTGSPEAAAACP